VNCELCKWGLTLSPFPVIPTLTICQTAASCINCSMSGKGYEVHGSRREVIGVPRGELRDLPPPMNLRNIFVLCDSKLLLKLCSFSFKSQIFYRATLKITHTNFTFCFSFWGTSAAFEKFLDAPSCEPPSIVRSWSSAWIFVSKKWPPCLQTFNMIKLKWFIVIEQRISFFLRHVGVRKVADLKAHAQRRYSASRTTSCFCKQGGPKNWPTVCMP